MQAPDALRLKRRHFLASAGFGLAGAALPALLVSVHEHHGAMAPWDTLLHDTRAAVAVGRQYLRLHPQEASVEWLSRSLFRSDWSPDPVPFARERARAHIRHGRQRDFRVGDVVVIDGWFFARTEGRLLALLALRAA